MDASATFTTAGTLEVRVVIQAEQVAVFAALVADLLRPDTPAERVWPEWMNVETAARYLDCTPERIRKLVAGREIPYHQEAPGCRIFFRRQELDSWMATFHHAARR